MRVGDVIVEFAGMPIKEVTDLQKRVAAVEPGKPAALTVIRDKRPTRLSVRIGEQPSEEVPVVAQPREERLGLTVEPLTAESAERAENTKWLCALGGLGGERLLAPLNAQSGRA